MKRKTFDASKAPAWIPLDSVRVASPCHADWDAMRGDDRARFCPSCAKNVYNLSAMTAPEAQALLADKAGSLCVRFYQREDGTMLTQDCPVGVAALKERSPSFALWAGVASLLAVVAALASPSFLTGAHAQPESGADPAPTATATPLSGPAIVMGDVAGVVLPTATPQPPTTVTMGAPIPPTPPPLPPPPPAATPVAPRVSITGNVAVAPVPSATPAPVKHVRMGKFAAPTPKPVPTPTPSDAVAVMGGMRPPVPTPAPLMGRMVRPHTPKAHVHTPFKAKKPRRKHG